MAAEKHSDNRHSIVDQDAAITAYLDGLLRDPDAEHEPEVSTSRRVPGLKVINVPETPAAADPAGDERPDGREAAGIAAMPAVDEPEHDRGDVALDAPDEAMALADEMIESSDAETGLSDAASLESPVTSSPVTPESADSTVAVEAPIRETPGQAASVEALAEPQTREDESSIPVESAEHGPWRWLRVGGMTMAIPADAVASRHPDPVLEPVPGAPTQIAGALSVDGRLRLILSLSALTGLKARGKTQGEVFLLGKGGLWGVLGERVEQPPDLNEASVEWRSETQKASRRAWLAGTASAAGVVVLDEAGLRAALKTSR
ncbi:MAG: chemotaxis protein CheW [Guyparkeria sp.]